MPPRAKKRVWRPFFEPKVFRKQMCDEEALTILLGLSALPVVIRRAHSYSALGELCLPFPTSLRPFLLHAFPLFYVSLH